MLADTRFSCTAFSSRLFISNQHDSSVGMPLLSLPADVLLEIFSYMDSGSPLSATCADNSTSTLATVSLVCKHLCTLARRPLLRSLRWCDKTKTNLNLNQWQRNPSYTSSLYVPKKLVMEIEFDFEAQSLDEVSGGSPIYLSAERSLCLWSLSGAWILFFMSAFTHGYRALAHSAHSSSATPASARNTSIPSSCRFLCFDLSLSSTSNSRSSRTTMKPTTPCPRC